MTRIVFETHSITEDNESGHATGWLPGRLSKTGRALAAELGARRSGDGIDAVFTSDLRRAAETAEIAFGGTGIPILADWRLRECDYGRLNGHPVAEVHAHRSRTVDEPYPDGESWRAATNRVIGALSDLPTRWAGARVLVIGHIATRWGLEHALAGVPLATLAAREFVWQPGWEYYLPADSASTSDAAGISRPSR